MKICYKDMHTDYIHLTIISSRCCFLNLMQEMLKRKVAKYNSHRFEHSINLGVSFCYDSDIRLPEYVI